ncbi:MAG TPA: ABC transporter ATP-binding protein [Candidatus Limnocylindrales bacterium]
MGDVAISVEGLGKRYQIGHQRDPYGRLTESLWGAIRRPLDLVRQRRATETSEWIWALRDVSFEVRQGDVVGVIGRNGSGKTTLLKVLSRITEPTTGTAVLHGRVGSLLEVGTGFHQELTGRENVFMSGAVLGMRRAEIIRKFDEIVAFAGVEQFLDTPVKRYSSGMQVRLGFAVAAHLDPEILFIDEVLAVGDAEFQKKCLGKMSELGQGGRTILFVSHSMPAVLRLCERAILLDRGRVVTAGHTSHVVRTYLETDVGRTSERRWGEPATAPGDSVARLRLIKVSPARGGLGEEIDITDAIVVEVEYWVASKSDRGPLLNIDVFNDEGICVFGITDQTSDEWKRLSIPTSGVIRSVCTVPGNFLAEGRFTVNVAVVTYNPTTGRAAHGVELDAVAFQVVDRTSGEGARGAFSGEWPGVVRPLFEWSIGFSADA